MAPPDSSTSSLDTISWKEQRLRFTSELDRMRTEENLTDCVLVCGDRRFPAHKTILRAASDYFDAIFGAAAAGTRESVAGEVDLGAYSPDAVEAVLEFIYKGTVAEVVHLRELGELLRASRAMQIEMLYAYYTQEVEDALNADTCVEVWRMLRSHDANAELRERAVRMIADCHPATEVFFQTQYLNLGCEEVKELLKEAPLKPDRVAHGVMAWVQFSVEERRDKLNELLDELVVDLGEVESANLTSALRNDVSLSGTRQPSEIVNNKFVATPLSRTAPAQRAQSAQASDPQPANQSIVVFTNENKRGVMKVMDVTNGSWSRTVQLPFGVVRGAALVEHGGHVYFFGGRERERTVLKYSPVSNTAYSIGGVKADISDAGAGVHRGFIYLVGGYKTKRAQRFNPATGELCTRVAPTNDFHQRPFVFEGGEHLYVVGSVGSGGRSLERYDDATDQWTVVTRVPYNVTYGTEHRDVCALYRGDLVVNCDRDTPKFHKYDLGKREWSGASCVTNQPGSVHHLFSFRSCGEEMLVAADRFGKLTVVNGPACTLESICSRGNPLPPVHGHVVVVNSSVVVNVHSQ